MCATKLTTKNRNQIVSPFSLTLCLTQRSHAAHTLKHTWCIFDWSMMIFICKNGESCIEIIAQNVDNFGSDYSMVLLFTVAEWLFDVDTNVRFWCGFSKNISGKPQNRDSLIEIPSNANKIMIKFTDSQTHGIECELKTVRLFALE